METQEKTQVQLLQDLIAVLGNRAALVEKLLKQFPKMHDGNKTMLQYKVQTRDFITALLSELSEYGDAVGDADADNEYNHYWKRALIKWDCINEYRAITLFKDLERMLGAMYKNTLEAHCGLAASFQTLLLKQLA